MTRYKAWGWPVPLFIGVALAFTAGAVAALIKQAPAPAPEIAGSCAEMRAATFEPVATYQTSVGMVQSAAEFEAAIRADERAKIVAWLRKDAETYVDTTPRMAVFVASLRVERGDHAKPEGT